MLTLSRALHLSLLVVAINIESSKNLTLVVKCLAVVVSWLKTCTAKILILLLEGIKINLRLVLVVCKVVTTKASRILLHLLAPVERLLLLRHTLRISLLIVSRVLTESIKGCESVIRLCLGLRRSLVVHGVKILQVKRGLRLGRWVRMGVLEWLLLSLISALKIAEAINTSRLLMLLLRWISVAGAEVLLRSLKI